MAPIHDALSEIQSKLHAPKNQRNNFGKYNYRKAEDIIAAFKEVSNGTTLTLSDDIQIIGDKLFLRAIATLYMGEKSISVEGWAMHALSKKGMDEAQITGSCSSYARKYALCGLFAIDDSDQDPDSKRPPEPERAPKQDAPGIYKRPDNATTKTVMDALCAAIESCNTMTSLNNLLGNQSFDADWAHLDGKDPEKAQAVRDSVDSMRNKLGE